MPERQASELLRDVSSENSRLRCALERLIVTADEFKEYADLPTPGLSGDDVRHDVWRAALIESLAHAKETLGRWRDAGDHDA